MTPSHENLHAHQAQHGIFFHPKNAISHNRDISAAWTTFDRDKSDGFTQASVTRLNDSIRTYVRAILGSQAQTRTNILSAGPGFDAKKQFLANVEDSISSPADIPNSPLRSLQPAIQSRDVCLPDMGRGKEALRSRQQTTSRSGIGRERPRPDRRIYWRVPD